MRQITTITTWKCGHLKVSVEVEVEGAHGEDGEDGERSVGARDW
jgi:hypothetical protein